MTYVLIISSSNDVSADVVGNHLYEYHHNPLRINSDKISSKNYISACSTPLNMNLCINNKTYSTESLRSIWYRKPNLWFLDFNSLSSKELSNLEYKRSENLQVMRSFMNFAKTKNIFLVSDIESIRKANDKIQQLILAASIGLTIPKTLVSSNKDKLINFVESHNSVIIKSFGPYCQSLQLEANRYFTKRVDLQKFKDFTNQFEIDHPIFLQKEVQKKYELRVTVVGNRVFACKINSQLKSNASIDFRRCNPNDLEHEQYFLPEEIEAKCLKLCRTLDLQYGAIDIAVDIEGNHIFFEINPNGQYYWIEKLTGMQISKALAELLCFPEKFQLT